MTEAHSHGLSQKCNVKIKIFFSYERTFSIVSAISRGYWLYCLGFFIVNFGQISLDNLPGTEHDRAGRMI